MVIVVTFLSHLSIRPYGLSVKNNISELTALTRLKFAPTRGRLCFTGFTFGDFLKNSPISEKNASQSSLIRALLSSGMGASPNYFGKNNVIVTLYFNPPSPLQNVTQFLQKMYHIAMCQTKVSGCHKLSSTTTPPLIVTMTLLIPQ